MPRKDDKVVKKQPQEWKPEAKLQIVLEAAALSEGELGVFLRGKGIHEALLTEWRDQALAGLRGTEAASKLQTQRETREMRELRRELKRKDKALAETAALYRVLRAEKLQNLRGRARPPAHPPREHEADGAWQLASWDITYLRSHRRGGFFYLYMVEDIWSRKILGWEVEAAELSAQLIERIRQDHPEKNLIGWILHSDNGGPMKGATMLATLQRLGVVTSFSRPRVSDDNPFVEALFRTLKYWPEYSSSGFASVEAARARRSYIPSAGRRGHAPGLARSPSHSTPRSITEQHTRLELHTTTILIVTGLRRTPTSAPTWVHRPRSARQADVRLRAVVRSGREVDRHVREAAVR